MTLPRVAIPGPPHIYRVEWEETAFDLSGAPVAAESGRWQAHLSVADVNDTATRARMRLRLSPRNSRNLLGIAVDAIQWQLSPPLTPKSAADRTKSVTSTTRAHLERELLPRAPSSPTRVPE